MSNLAFPTTGRAGAYARLRELGVEGVEVAPTRLGPWEALSGATMRAEARLLADHGLSASSMQALFHGLPQLQLLADPWRFRLMREHVARLGGFADALGARTAVLGAPKNRRRGHLEPEEAGALAVVRLRALGDALAGSDLVLGLEPVPEHYGADFLTTAAAAEELVRRVDHPGVGLHLDTGCAALAGDDMAAAVRSGHDVLVHVQAAEPDLGSFEDPQVDHVGAAAALVEVGYGGWVAIEMREQAGRAWPAVEQAVHHVRAAYGDRP